MGAKGAIGRDGYNYNTMNIGVSAYLSIRVYLR